MTISRFVTLLTPVFAALAGWLCDVAAQYLPGHPTLDRGELTVLFVTGATAGAAAAVKWLHGRSQHERLTLEIAELEAARAKPDPPVAPSDPPKAKPKPRTRRKAPAKRAPSTPEAPASA